MPSLLKKGTKSRVEIKFSTVLREVLRNNYQSRNLIGPYHFWGISPRNLVLFTRPFIGGRRARAGHETTSLHGLCLWVGKVLSEQDFFLVNPIYPSIQVFSI